LEVVSVDVQVLKKLGSDGVIAAFGEVPWADEVTAAEMYTDVQV